MDVYGELRRAQLENRTSDYAGTITGIIYHHTTEKRVKFANGTSVISLLGNDGKAVFGTSVTATDNVRFHRPAGGVFQFVLGDDVTAEGTLATVLAQTSARLENYTNLSRPTFGNAGRLIWNSDATEAQIDTGSAWSSVGSGGGSGAAGIDMLIQKADQERYGVKTSPLSNSALLSGKIAPFEQSLEGTLLSDYASGAVTMGIVWNALSFDTGSPNYDSITGWAVTGAGATLTASNTAGDFVVGTKGLKFDKDNSAVKAGIRYTRSAQDLSLGNNTRLWAKFHLPSTTQLSNIYARIFADTTSNYAEFTVATQYDGSAFVTSGFNTLFFDLAATAAAVGGTGWIPSQLVKYFEIGVTTSAAGQTYTGLIADAMFASYSNIVEFGVISNEFSIFDNSATNNRLFSSTNTLHDGPLTLSSSIAANISGGVTGSSRGRVRRSVMRVTGGAIQTDIDSTLSGAVTLDQNFRIGTILRASANASYAAYVDQAASQRYKVSTIGVSTIGVTDPADQHLNLLNVDLIDIFRPQNFAGVKTYTIVKSTALTANSTASGGVTTLTLPVSSIQVNDIVVKRTTSVAFSSVSAQTTDESYSTLTTDVDPNGVALIESFVYPNEKYVVGHYALGASSNAEAARNRKGVLPDLIVNGTPNIGAAFLAGRLGANNLSNTNFFAISSALSQIISGDTADGTPLVHSFWFFDPSGFTGSPRYIAARHNGAGTGYYFTAGPSANNIVVTFDSVSFSMAYAPAQWNLVTFFAKDSGVAESYGYLNTTKSAAQTVGIGNVGTEFNIGRFSAAGAGPDNIVVADWIIWLGGPDWTDSNQAVLYNNGNYLDTLSPETLRLSYTAASQVGAKVSMLVRSQRSTTAVTPTILGAGFIKS